MKRFICFVLSTVLTMMMCVPIHALSIETNDDIITNMTSTFVYVGHGEFRKSETLLINTCTDLNSVTVGRAISASATLDTDYYKINDNQYLVKVSDDVYFLSDRISIDMTNVDDYYGVFEAYGVSEYLRSDIERVIAQQTMLGNTDFSIELFAPSLYSFDNDVSLMADEPLGTRYYIYNYNGTNFNMKDYSVKYSNLHTDELSYSGVNTLNVAKGFTGFTAGVVSLSSIKYVSLFGTLSGLALSAYDIYQNISGSEVTMSTADDILHTVVHYARVVKETYCQDPIALDFPNAGCVSQKVWIGDCYTYQYYDDTGIPVSSKTTPSHELYSEHFQDPCPMAIECDISTTYYDLPIRATILGTTWNFTDTN